MDNRRITRHPVLAIPAKPRVYFTWNGKPLQGYAGEMISSALTANNVRVFGHHPKDNSPQGLFCANGQCSQCLVIADGKPVKACMTALSQGIDLFSVEGLPDLPAADQATATSPIGVTEVDVLIIGGGPAGISAAIELGKRNIPTLLIDDKDRLGGKLVLQTHKFFGSVGDSYAGTRGFDIGHLLEKQLRELSAVSIRLNTTAVGVFSDGIVGMVEGNHYAMIKPRKLLVATGAREKSLAFPGNTLPGVYGAGAFQTLVNRDLIRSSSRILVVGGGNVGLIGAYHAIQADMEIVALIEALPEVGGYKVHADKLARLGIPILTGHTVVAAHGTEQVESVTIAALDNQFTVIPQTSRRLSVDTVLIAVGLSEVNEFYHKAKAWGMDVYSAGDAQEIAEASAAMFTGKIEGVKIARSLGVESKEVPLEWDQKVAVLKSKPGPVRDVTTRPKKNGVYPVLHCRQEVPCNPCTSVCKAGIIQTENNAITGIPHLVDADNCTGCHSCAAVCPGLAISIVDYRKNADQPLVTLPYEIWREHVDVGKTVEITDIDGNRLGSFPVEKIITKKKYPDTLLVKLRMDPETAHKAIGIRIREQHLEPLDLYEHAPLADDAVICRCERVTAGDIRKLIQGGMRDMNQLKAITRAGMGSCGSKTCRPMIWRLFQEEGVARGSITDRVDRPLFVEVPMGNFAGTDGGGSHD